MTEPPCYAPERALHPLWHFRIGPDAEWDEDGSERLVGIYASAASAEAAIVRLRGKPGFRAWPGGFRRFGDTLDDVAWTGGFITWEEALDAPAPTSPMPRARRPRIGRRPAPVVPGMRLYRLVHRTGGAAADEKGIGVYSSPVRAKAAIRRVCGDVGFRDWPDGFVIEEYRLDQDALPDGLLPEGAG